MIKFHFNLAPNPTNVAQCLEEMGLKYEIVPVHTHGRAAHARVLAVNPNAKVPAINDAGATVFDSNAILIYLAEKTGQYLPGTSLRATGVLNSMTGYMCVAAILELRQLSLTRKSSDKLESL